eukprot:CAMPEP_0172176938 /NCGR_PEP_ID=MMETSP1050-20130122/15131_1 /TAXON_ID=233186 /ORGANISM="Cryptomonas curvata, Strain CCAP979/52" /LENGTH=344 /DNA_ID=CAMNT_0012849347 /DNA_START=451 /DNA_END=1485 /DNA_ORIENTATION=+
MTRKTRVHLTMFTVRRNRSTVLRVTPQLVPESPWTRMGCGVAAVMADSETELALPPLQRLPHTSLLVWAGLDTVHGCTSAPLWPASSAASESLLVTTAPCPVLRSGPSPSSGWLRAHDRPHPCAPRIRVQLLSRLRRVRAREGRGRSAPESRQPPSTPPLRVLPSLPPTPARIRRRAQTRLHRRLGLASIERLGPAAAQARRALTATGEVLKGAAPSKSIACSTRSRGRTGRARSESESGGGDRWSDVPQAVAPHVATLDVAAIAIAAAAVASFAAPACVAVTGAAAWGERGSAGKHFLLLAAATSTFMSRSRSLAATVTLRRGMSCWPDHGMTGKVEPDEDDV